ncbi:MAG: hypothetical protein V2A61_04655 [Calditrichota bacterium]
MNPSNDTFQSMKLDLELPDGFKEYCLYYSRLAALGFMASAIMHEIGNAATVISGNAQIMIMKRGGSGPEDLLPRLERMMEQVDRIQAAMGRVGSFSSRVAGKEKNISPVSAVNNALYALKRRCNITGVTLTADLPSEERAVRCDPTLLEFILMELLSSFWRDEVKGGQLEV